MSLSSRAERTAITRRVSKNPILFSSKRTKRTKKSVEPSPRNTGNRSTCELAVWFRRGSSVSASRAPATIVRLLRSPLSLCYRFWGRRAISGEDRLPAYPSARRNQLFLDDPTSSSSSSSSYLTARRTTRTVSGRRRHEIVKRNRRARQTKKKKKQKKQNRTRSLSFCRCVRTTLYDVYIVRNERTKINTSSATAVSSFAVMNTLFFAKFLTTRKKRLRIQICEDVRTHARTGPVIRDRINQADLEWNGVKRT